MKLPVNPPRESAPFRGKERRRFVAGVLLSAGLLVGVAEGFLRLFPMPDLHLYLGEESPSSGPFVADPEWVVAYRNWDAFAAENEKALAPYLPLSGNADPRPVWAFFGNSFVQDPGGLADSVRDKVSDRHVFKLGRLEQIEVRLAQVRLLLEHGFRPERLFVELMCVDTLRLGPHPLASTRVTPRGAITYVPVLPPGPLGRLIGQSRLALTARVRVGDHKGNSRFNMVHLYQRVEEPLLGDLCRLFGNLARLTRKHNIPTTIGLLPDNNQILRRSGFAFQDAFTPLLHEMGFDVFDPREAFLAHPDPASLYMKCGHFNAVGNRIQADDLLRHLQGRKKREHTVLREGKR